MNGLIDLLKKFSPLNAEEAAAEREPADALVVPEAASAPAPSPIAEPEQGLVDELNVREKLAPIYEKREPITLPRVKIPDENSADMKKKWDELNTKLDNLKIRQQADVEDASKRQMYAEMIAALGNNIGLISAGQAAMASGANVQAPKTASINVGDLVGQVNKRFDRDYDNLIKQYKALKDGGLDAKTRLFADMHNSNIAAREASLNANMQNTDRNLVARGTSIEAKEQEKNELSDKQNETLNEYDEALKSINRTAEYKKGIKTGPVQDLRNMLAKQVGWDDPKVSKLRAQIIDDLAKRIKFLSGTAANEAEAERLSFTLPSLGDNEQTFNELLDLAKTRIQEAKAIREASYSKRQGKHLGYKQPSTKTVRIQGPSGQTATVSEAAAEKYLSRPGYKRLD